MSPAAEIPSSGRSAAWIGVLKKSARRFAEHDMSTYASALAFQAFFSIFPFLLFLIALLGFLNLSQFFDWLKLQVAVMVPAQAVDQITKVIEQIESPNAGLLSLGIAVAIWSASSGIRAAMIALNVAYGVQERRPAWLRILLSVIYTVGLACLLALAGLMFSVGPGAAQWVSRQFGLGTDLALLWSLLRWPIWLALLALTVTLIYSLAPNRRQRLRALLPGALLSIFTWVAASIAFNIYLSNFANYSALYGSIGTIIAILFYFSLTASVLLFGAEVNAVLEQQKEGAVTRSSDMAGPVPTEPINPR